MASEKALIVRATAAGGDHQGQIVEIVPGPEGTRVAVAFESNFPSILIAEQLTLRVIGAKGDSFAAKIIYQGRDERGIRCQFIVGPEAHPCLQPVFNARELVRVRPAASEPVSAIVSGKEFVLHDISVGGVALLVPKEEQGHLPKSGSVRFSLRLPREKQPFEIVGDILHRRLLGSSVVYGIKFDERATASFPDREAQIHQYVMQRQYEQLRQKRKAD